MTARGGLSSREEGEEGVAHTFGRSTAVGGGGKRRRSEVDGGGDVELGRERKK